MYERFFGLNELPFSLTPDPRYLLLTPRHREALGVLQYAFSSRKGLTVLTGEAGTGKTTLLRTAMAEQAAEHTLCRTLTNPALTRDEFLQLVAQAFELAPGAADSKATFLVETERLLRERHERKLMTVLVIDEAQSLSYGLLEEIRLLANMETDTSKLLSVVLAGQPELADRLNEPALRQLKQRVVLRAELKPLGLQEAASYIAGRIRVAGGDCARLFTREAVMLIHDRSHGIPRTISVICDNALLSGFALGRQPVDSKIVLDVCQDFDLKAATAASIQRDDLVAHATIPDQVIEIRGQPKVDSSDGAPENRQQALRALDEPRRRFFARSNVPSRRSN